MQLAPGRTLIEARALRKAFGLSLVLRDVDLAVESGESVAILGPNGAGKSTLLRVLACIARASGGSLALFGTDCHPGRAPAEVLARLGFLGHEPLVYQDLTPRQNLELFARLYPPRRDADGSLRPEKLARDGLERVGLGHAMERPTRALSRGMLQRLALARATLHRPELLLLDEPFTALDEAGSELLTAELHAFTAAGGTVVMVTHDLARVALLARRVVVLAGGRVVADAPAAGDAAELASGYRRLTGLET